MRIVLLYLSCDPPPPYSASKYIFLFILSYGRAKNNSLIIFFYWVCQVYKLAHFLEFVIFMYIQDPNYFCFELETLETSSILWLSTGDSSVTGKCKWKISCKMWQNKNNKSYNLWIIVKDRVSTGIEQAISKLFRIHRNSISKALSYLCCV